MINGRHRHKLIEGLVLAMGKPDSGGSSSKGSPPEGSDEEEKSESPKEEDDEGIQCAKDAARALGMDDLDDDKARAFAEAIRTIASGYDK